MLGVKLYRITNAWIRRRNAAQRRRSAIPDGEHLRVQ